MPRDAKGEAGTIVPFGPRPVRLRRSSAPGGPERGTVLLFTGVRYERLAPEEGLPGQAYEKAAPAGDHRIGA